MHQAGHLRRLASQSGTCLRTLPWRAAQSQPKTSTSRRGSAFEAAFLGDIENELRTRIGQRYGLDVSVGDADCSSMAGTGPARRFVNDGHPPRGPELAPWREAHQAGDRRPGGATGRRAAPAVRQRHALLADDFSPFADSGRHPWRTSARIEERGVSDVGADGRQRGAHQDVWDIACIGSGWMPMPTASRPQDERRQGRGPRRWAPACPMRCG